MDNQLFSLIKFYLKELNLQFDKEELRFQLLSHPSYPSLHSVIGVLDHFKLDNLALELPVSREVLNQCPEIFMSLISISGHKEYTVVKKSKNSFECVLPDKQTLKLSISEFLEKWTGIVVVVEPDENEKIVRKTDFKKALSYLCVAIGFLLVITFFYEKPSFFESLYLALSIIGVVITSLIIRHEFGFYSKFTEKFCSINKDTDCDAVLNSRGATFFGFLKLSDVSLVYFVSLTLILLISNSTAVLNLLSFLSVLSLPMIVYSIYYQLMIIKHWCTMCLGILSVMVLQLTLVFIFNGFNTFFEWSMFSVLITVLSFLLSVVMWGTLRPLLISKKELIKLRIDHLKFKRNFSLFEAVLYKGEPIDTFIDANEISLGETNAPVKIVLITNPMCGYCKSAHHELMDILTKYPEAVSIKVRFNVSSMDTSSQAYKIATRLLALCAVLPKDKFVEEFDKVYSSEFDAESWITQWNELDTNAQSNVLSVEQEWCHKHQINFTPALIVNGHNFPKEYERSDLFYFIEDLVEGCIESTEEQIIELNSN